MRCLWKTQHFIRSEYITRLCTNQPYEFISVATFSLPSSIGALLGASCQEQSTVNKCLKLNLNRFLTLTRSAFVVSSLRGGRPHLEDKVPGGKRKCTQNVSIHTSNPASVSDSKLLQATKDQRSESKGEAKIWSLLLEGSRERTTLMCLLEQKSARVMERLSETRSTLAGEARVRTIMPHLKQRRQRGIHLGPPDFTLIRAIRAQKPSAAFITGGRSRHARLASDIALLPQHLARLPAQFWYSCYGNCPQGRSSTDSRVGKGDVSFIIQMLIALRKARERFVCQIQLVFAQSSVELNHSVAALQSHHHLLKKRAGTIDRKPKPGDLHTFIMHQKFMFLLVCISQKLSRGI